MAKGTPETTTMNVTEARAQFSSLLNSVFRGEQRVIVEKNGIPVGVLVSVPDLEILERFDAETEYRQRILAAIREPFKDVPAEEIEAEVARMIEEDRAEQRAARLVQQAS